jgi:hexosaminidase
VIIPRPSGLTRRPGRFTIGPELHLDAGPGAGRAARLLAGYLGDGRPRGDTGPPIRLALTPSGSAEGGESYRLLVAPDRVELTAAAERGLFNGVQTLRQLLPPAALGPEPVPPREWWWPCVEIEDRPRLGWRGLLLDTARHFVPLRDLFGLTDQLALHKLNVLHLHLTDDQGWRIEIDGWPRLTEVGARRPASQAGPTGTPAGRRLDGVPHAGFYTQAELRALVAHAAARGVTVVPEIEMPGHARAAVAAYPWLGNRPERALDVWQWWGVSEHTLGVSDRVLDFCRQVLAQTMDVFPSRHVHIGGDECPTGEWEASPAARDRARRLGLGSPAELHGWFLGRMHAFLAAHGRRTVCWDETGQAPGEPPPSMVLTAWRDPAHAVRAVARGHQVVMAPHLATYLDYPQRDPLADVDADPGGPGGHGAPAEPPGQPGATVTLSDVYGLDPLAGGLPAADPFAEERRPGVLGAQAQLWTEYAPTPAHIRRLLWPRLCALAEVTWAGGGDEAEFRARLAPHAARLAALGAVDAPWPAVPPPRAIPVPVTAPVPTPATTPVTEPVTESSGETVRDRHHLG